MILSSIRPIETCYRYYKTESFQHFRGFQNFFFLSVDTLTPHVSVPSLYSQPKYVLTNCKLTEKRSLLCHLNQIN
jgi:hypothetical protein